MLVALLAGLWAGLLATALAVLATAYLVMPPIGSFAVADTSEGISLALFAGMGIFMSLIAEHYRRSQRLIAVYQEEQALREGEDKLRQASEFIRVALDAAELGTWEFLPETLDVHVDDNCRKLFGFQPGEAFASTDLTERIHPEDRSSVDDAIKKSIARSEEHTSE